MKNLPRRARRLFRTRRLFRAVTMKRAGRIEEQKGPSTSTAQEVPASSMEMAYGTMENTDGPLASSMEMTYGTMENMDEPLGTGDIEEQKDLDDTAAAQEVQASSMQESTNVVTMNNTNETLSTLATSPEPDDSLPLATTQHLGSSRQYWRDIILGVNDGLVSTLLLVAGVAGGGLSSVDILLTAIAGALAGAVSMCAGEYVATKSQNEVMHGEIALEKEHIRKYLEDEISELGSHLGLIGIPQEETETDLRQQLLTFYRQHPDALLKLMIALEFGVIAEEERSPVRAGLTSCALFILGAMPSVLPFIFSGVRPGIALIVAAVLTTTALLVVGAVKAWATRGNCLTAAAENVIISGVGGAFAYGVGVFFDSVLH